MAATMEPPLAYGLRQVEALVVPDDASAEERRNLRAVFLAGAWLCNEMHKRAVRLMLTDPTQANELMVALQMELIQFGCWADTLAEGRLIQPVVGNQGARL